MKYIRTKDENNLIIDMTNIQSFHIPYNLTNEFIDFNQFGMFKIIKQSDTIEELCDCFVVEGDDNEITYHKTLFSAETDGKDYILESNETYTIYGCVLVKGKGLIYVAKMNDKGELELL